VTGCEKAERNILAPVSDTAAISAWMYEFLLIICSIIMLLVAAWFVYSVVRFREVPGDDSLPPQIHGHTALEIGWTIVPTIIVIAIMIPTILNIFELEKPPAEGEDKILINVVGKQWWWEYDYVNEGFLAANEMHVEVDKPVHLQVTSADVIHAWWVPQVTGKRDATPGRTYPMYFTVSEVGVYKGQCAELCGASHAEMAIKLIVHPKEGPDSYNNWVLAQQKAAEPARTPLAEKGKKLFIEKGCMRCHNIRGDARTQLHRKARVRWTGPDLTHVGSRTTIASMTYPNTRENIAKWVYDPQSMKEAVLMGDPRIPGSVGIGENQVSVSKEEAEAIATYLFRLK
jgi:cytochrome c oxidase subunit 2